MLIEYSYKALYNTITRSIQDKASNKRLMEKSLRLEAIVEAMKERGESEEYIQEVRNSLFSYMLRVSLFALDYFVIYFQIQETLTPPEKEILEGAKTRIKTLGSAEIGLDDTLFLFQLFLYYQPSAINR
jgi:DNA-directed RNA polymerase III subunit RPC3